MGISLLTNEELFDLHIAFPLVAGRILWPWEDGNPVLSNLKERKYLILCIEYRLGGVMAMNMGCGFGFLLYLSVWGFPPQKEYQNMGLIDSL